MSYVQYVRATDARVFIAVPCYSKLSAPFVMSLFGSRDIPGLSLEVLSGNCHVDDARNRLVRDFLDTDCEQMVFIDADVCWHAPELLRLIEYPQDIVAGIYPKRVDDDVEFPVISLPGERWSNRDGLVEVAAVASGFTKIRRPVLATLYESAAKHRDHDNGEGRPPIGVIFERGLDGLSRIGGDINFCEKARRAGFRVFVDPTMHLGHEGSKIYRGCLGHHWRKDVAIREGIEAIRKGIDTPATYLEMYNVWGNNWALGPEALYACVLLARQSNGPVLECGSGLSSLCLAAASGQPVDALESDPIWASRVSKLALENGLDHLNVHFSELVEYPDCRWYGDVPGGNYSLLIVDGPPRQNGGRDGVFRLMSDQIAEAIVLIDDIENCDARDFVERYCKEHDRRLDVIDAARPFGIVR